MTAIQVSKHAAQRGRQRRIYADDVWMAWTKPAKIFRYREGIAHRRGATVVILSPDRRTLITTYRWNPKRHPELA